jgi:hypothetical protein
MKGKLNREAKLTIPTDEIREESKTAPIRIRRKNS